MNDTTAKEITAEGLIVDRHGNDLLLQAETVVIAAGPNRSMTFTKI